MKLTFLFLGFSVIISSCLRLDDFLYNPNYNPITEYKLYEYDGEQEFTLEDNYNINDDKHYLFQISSNDDGDVKNIWALYIGDTAKIKTDTVILYCHGNKDHMDFYYPRTQLLAWTGNLHRFGIMTFDYRGFGLSEGKSSESSLYADTDAAIKWLKKMGLTSDRLIIYGFSMGTAPATKIAAGNYSLKPSALILEAPFASGEVFVQDAAGFALPGSYIVSLSIANAEEIKSVNAPFLWLHGKNDDFISIKNHGEVVYANYKGQKGVAHRVNFAGHSDIPIVLQLDNYLNIIENFILENN